MSWAPGRAACASLLSLGQPLPFLCRGRPVESGCCTCWDLAAVSRVCEGLPSPTHAPPLALRGPPGVGEGLAAALPAVGSSVPRSPPPPTASLPLPPGRSAPSNRSRRRGQPSPTGDWKPRPPAVPDPCPRAPRHAAPGSPSFSRFPESALRLLLGEDVTSLRGGE